jgi:hypothetical protein
MKTINVLIIVPFAVLISALPVWASSESDKRDQFPTTTDLPPWGGVIPSWLR